MTRLKYVMKTYVVDVYLVLLTRRDTYPAYAIYCNFYRCKNANFQITIVVCFLFLLKTWNVGTRYSHLNDAILTSIHLEQN